MFLAAFVFLLGTSLVRGSLPEGCVCSLDGVSNGVKTKAAGCAAHPENPDDLTCYVQSSKSCSSAKKSKKFPKAAFIDCSADVLRFAAQSDAVGTIHALRKRGVKTKIKITIPSGKSKGKQYPLVAYAASFGSYDVVEDLITNKDYQCDKKNHPESKLCEFSEDRFCAPGYPSRDAIEEVIKEKYNKKCSIKDKSKGSKNCGGFQYFVSIGCSKGKKFAHKCAGVLVSKDTVLTSASCAEKVQKQCGRQSVQLSVGQHGTKGACPKPEIHKPADMKIHPNWSSKNSFGNGYDVAVVKLSKASKKKPITLSRKVTIKPLEDLFVLGLGGKASSLQWGELPLMNTACDIPYEDEKFTGKFRCSVQTAEFCKADDGAPLIQWISAKETILVGVAHKEHLSEVCDDLNKPGLFVDIVNVYNWVTRSMK